jgi:hypothetical protein
VPGADQGISYGMPAFKVKGKAVAGFAAFKNHLSYMPHSGSVLATLRDDTAPYETSTLWHERDGAAVKLQSSVISCSTWPLRPRPPTGSPVPCLTCLRIRNPAREFHSRREPTPPKRGRSSRCQLQKSLMCTAASAKASRFISSRNALQSLFGASPMSLTTPRKRFAFSFTVKS